MAKTDWILRCLVVAGIALRLTGLTVHSLWYDEAALVYMATAPDWVEALQGSRHPPVSIVLLRGWIALFGQSDAMLRLLPALAACGSLLLFARLGSLCCTPAACRLAVAWFALSPFQIWYGQEVTPYAFLEFGALLAYCGAARALHQGAADARALGLVGFGVAIAFGAHYLGALAGIAIPAMALVGVASGRLPRRDGARLVATSALAGLVWVPWLMTSYWQHQRHTVWGHEARTSLRELAELPARLLMTEASALPLAWQWTGLLFGGLVWLGLVVGAIRAVRAPHGIGPIAAGLAAAVAVALVLAVVAKNFLPRYMTATAPLVVLVAAAGLAALPGRWSGALAGTVGALVLAGLAAVHKTGNRREDFRAACALLEQRWQAGDAVVAVSGTPEAFSQAPLRHYLRSRPDILASIRPPAERPAPTARLRALHVVYRKNSYAEPELQRVVAGRRETFAAAVHAKVEYRELQ